MRRLLFLALVAAFGLPLLGGDPAHAQNQRSWVASTGLDSNACTRAAPCATFAGAIAKTVINGEVNCVDEGEFSGGAILSIGKSITIDCHGRGALNPNPGISSGSYVVINVPVGNANDPLRTVRLRGLRISGAGLNASAGTRVGLEGIRILSALHVFIHDTVVTQFAGFGIADNRDGSGNLYVRNTAVQDNFNGISILPQLNTTIDVVIDNSHLNRNGDGLFTLGPARVVVNNSVFMGNAVRAVDADDGSSVSIDRSVINGNVTGIRATAGSTVRLANTDIMFNGTGISGTTFSFTNNRLVNIAAGTPPTPIGFATSDTGQQ